MRTREDNIFGVLRLLAATLVLVAHCWNLQDRYGPRLGGDTLGALGVAIFFAISGYLVTQSWAVDPRLGAFAIKRALRLLPGLWLAIAVAVVVVGPAFTSLPEVDYAESHQTLLYVVHNAYLHVDYGLPGVFGGNPGGSAVNGSLWTLPVEARCYAVVALLGVAGLLRRPLATTSIAALLVVLIPHRYADHGIGALAASVVGSPAGVILVAVFLASATLYLVRDRVPLDGRIAVACLAAFLLSGQFGDLGRAVLWTVTLPYLVLFAAYRGPRRLLVLTRPGDASYGMYLYGFIVQQAFLSGATSIPPLVLFALAAPITYALGLASWHLVESPALRLKRRLPLTPAALPVGVGAQAPAA